MQTEPGTAGVPPVLELLRHPTFLGSATAPDGIRVRQRLREMEDAARRRKTVAASAAVGSTILAAALIILRARRRPGLGLS
jgi:hypothetical protein